MELLHEKAGQFGVTVRRSFPAFDSLPGLRIALAMKIKVRFAVRDAAAVGLLFGYPRHRV